MAHITRFLRTHGRQAVIATVVVVGLAAGGVAYAVSGSGGSSSPQAAPPTTSAPTTTPPAPKRPKPVRGRLTAIAPGSWTLRTSTSETVTVIIDAKTKFGSKKAPSTLSAFAVGNRIVVSGQQTGASITATRIVMAPAKGAGAGAGATTTTTAPSAAG
jgi:Domain of unknown function (DUF5666)